MQSKMFIKNVIKMFIKKIKLKSNHFAGCFFFHRDFCLYRKYRKNVKICQEENKNIKIITHT